MNPFSTDGFLRRGECGDWPSLLVWEENVGDLMLWSAFMVIPAILLFIAWKRKVDLRPFLGTFLLFGTFTLLCGNTHFMGFLMWLWPAWWLDAHSKILAGGVAWVTALNLFWTLPRALDYVSQQQLSDAGSDLDEAYSAFAANLDEKEVDRTARFDKLNRAVLNVTKLIKKASRGN